MHNSIQARLLPTWFVLSAITLLAWWIGAHHGPGTRKPDVGVALGAIVMAAIKVRVIVREFMDVRHAPLRLQYVSDVLLALFVVALITAYLS